MKSRLLSLAACMVLAGITQARADEPQVRTWTDHTGSHETQAVFVRASGSKVTIRTPEGREINIALNRLSKADQEYVREQLGGAGTASGVSTGDWPCWRGPNHDGLAPADGAQLDWGSQPPKELWRKDIGEGYSSFAVAGGKVFTMGHQAGEDVVWCLDAMDGSVVWSHRYPAKSQSKNYPGTRATPAVDGGRVYTFGSESQALCLDATSGKVVWSRNLESDHRTERPGWWYAGSPVIVGDLVLLNIGTSGMALDKETGKDSWKKGSGKCGYASLVPSPDKRMVAVFSARKIFLSDLSSGRVKWGTTWETAHDVNAADPVFVDEKVFITSGYGHGCALLDASNGRIEWENKSMASQTIAPFLYKGYLFGADGSVGSARLVCVDPKDGSVQWKESLRVGGLSLAGDKLLVQGSSGTLSVVEASPDSYKLVGQTKVLDGTCWTNPVLTRGLLFCRNKEGRMVALDSGAR